MNYADFLRAQSLFAELTESELEVLVASFVERRFNASDVIFRSGERAVAMYVVVAGRLELSLERGDSVYALRTLSAGDPFGYTEVFDGGARFGTCSAATGGILLCLGRGELDRFLSAPSPLGFKLLEALTRQASAELRDALARRSDRHAANRCVRRAWDSSQHSTQNAPRSTTPREWPGGMDELDLLKDVKVVVSDADLHRSYKTR